MLRPTPAFVLGFSGMFTVLRASAGPVGYPLARPGSARPAGRGPLIAMGIAMVLPPVGWTPSSAPSSAASRGTRPAARRASAPSLLLTYSPGLGIPILLAAPLLTRTMNAFRWVRDRWTAVDLTAATLVIVAGCSWPAGGGS